MDKDAIKDLEKFIIYIQERECLWNQKNKHYHSRDIQRRIWNEVAEEFKIKGTYINNILIINTFKYNLQILCRCVIKL